MAVPSEPGKRPILDTLRWMSAFAVLNGHAVLAAWGEPSAYPNKGLQRELVSILESWPPAAVTIFFVISGYLVGGSVLRQLASFDLTTYTINRFSRIYVVLLPALAMLFALDGLAVHMDPSNPLYTTVWEPTMTGYNPVVERYRFADILGGLLSVPPGIVSEPVGSDIPLWSLGYEWLFYFLLPLALAATRGLHQYRGPRIAMLALALAIALTAGRQEFLALYWLVWMLGAFCGSRDNHPHVPTSWLVAIAVAVAIILLTGNLLDPRIDYFLLGPLVAVLLTQPRVLSLGLGPRIDTTLSGFSYSLYVIHAPVILFTAFIFYRERHLQGPGKFDPGFALVFYATAMGMCLLVALLFGILFERRTATVRATLRGFMAHAKPN